MSIPFRRTGELKHIGSYPEWLQEVVRDCEAAKRRIVEHELFGLMRAARLPDPVLRRFLIGGWSTIEQFPQFMALTLKKVSVGAGPGHDLARRYLIHNIRVEQKHADHWAEWAKVVGVTRDDFRHQLGFEPIQALAHWCWYVCDRAALPVAVAATNYAVEGVTGEWACRVCSSSDYAESLDPDLRGPAMRWLRLHAEYDDTHPWEALEIVASFLGHSPSLDDAMAVRNAIRTSYHYIEAGLDNSMTALLHGSFDETASNSSMLGLLDAA